MEHKGLTIGHLFPELLNIYSDRGNVITLQKRLKWREMTATVRSFQRHDALDFSELDIVLLGGGSERDQQTVCQLLQQERAALLEFVESGGVLLALCGGYPLLGKSYPGKSEPLPGLSLLDIHTEAGEERLLGDVVIRTQLCGEESLLVGFENHSGRTYIGDYQPLGTVCCGHGNNGVDGSCGVVYKNVIGTHLHGPLLPKNPKLADELLRRALLRKYGEPVELAPLCDSEEAAAHDYIVNRFYKQ